MSQNYYIIDYGKDTLELAEYMVNKLKKEGHHIVVYLTDLDNALMIQHVDEDEFLEHFKLTTE